MSLDIAMANLTCYAARVGLGVVLAHCIAQQTGDDARQRWDIGDER